MRRKLRKKRKERSVNFWLVFGLFFGILLLLVLITPTVAADGVVDQELKWQSREEVLVQKGDTLWGIARRYMQPGQDIRILIAHIQEVNELKPSQPIYPGQILLIPIN